MVLKKKYTIKSTAYPCKIAAIILTAGASSRMGSPKACLQYRDTTFLTTTVTALHAAGCTDICCITGYSREEIMKKHTHLTVKWIENPAPVQGMLSSFRCGVEAVAAHYDAVLLCLADHPAISAGTYKALCEEAASDKIVIPVYKGRRGHPTAFGKAFFNDILHAELPEGARSIIRRYAHAVIEKAVDDSGIHADIDTPTEYREFLQTYTPYNTQEEA